MKISVDDAYEKIVRTFTDDDSQGSAFLVTGAPRSGKTTLARELAVRAAEVYGTEDVTLAVSNRLIADQANRVIIRKLVVSGQRRLTTTLSALAFRIVDERQMLLGAPAPKLINGAEQTAALREVLDRHVHHAQTGDLCDTCLLLRAYFEGNRSSSRDGGYTDNAHADNGERAYRTTAYRTTASLFDNYITPVFLQQLRDMFARMNELGASYVLEDRIVQAVESTHAHDDQSSTRFAREYTALQFKLAYALHREYSEEVSQSSDTAISRQLLLDSSRLLREAALTFANGTGHQLGIAVPQIIIVDDAQELTLAATFLLTELQKLGTRIVLIGNPDESVLGFRGAYPEFVWNHAYRSVGESNHNGFLSSDFGHFHAQRIDLMSGYDVDAMTYKDVVASRVALNIPSTYETDIPLPSRAQKFPDFADMALPNAALRNIMGVREDAIKTDSVTGHLFRSAREESEFVVHSILHERIEHNRSWNDIAIIVHDNAAARAYGERLQREGVPVRFSAVSKPLGEDAITLGLFAAMELGVSNWTDYDTCDELLSRTAYLCEQFAHSPFSADASGSTLNMGHVDSALRAIETIIQAWRTHSVESAVDSGAETVRSESADSFADMAALDNAWSYVCDHWSVADTDYPLNVSALKVLLLHDVSGVREIILRLMSTMRAEYAHDVSSLHTLIDMMTAVRETDKRDVLSALWAAWQASNVADIWQKKALDFSNFAQRLRYNQWLDSAMRLFDYAQQKNSRMNVCEFIEHVINLEISADSLAQLAPVNEAVTVTTPASTMGRSWTHVWMPGIQQGTWPNLTVRNTMFGADDLADVIMHGSITQTPHDRMLDVLHSEKRSFLVSLTRASKNVHVSAVWNDASTPSDFLYEYMHELFPRVSSMDNADFTALPVVHIADDSLEEELGTIEQTSINDVIRQARVTIVDELLRYEEVTDKGRDALSALDYLRTQGYDFASPEKWSFVNSSRIREVGNTNDESHKTSHEDSQDNEKKPVRLSPSNVENIWGCPICYRLENKLSGPRADTAATTFGTLIHNVAQWASEERGFDTTEFYNSALQKRGSEAVVIAYVAQEMYQRYNELKSAPNSDAGMREYLRELNNDDQALDILTNIAHYLVASHNLDMATDDKFHLPYIPLTHTDSEFEFDAFITMEDIRYAYNAIPKREPLTRYEFEKLMRMLVWDMPSGFSYDTVVHLHGFIDRVEQHGDSLYVVDYKTVSKPHNLHDTITNLQLVSYQLGLIFHGKKHDTDAERAELFRTMPRIDMSVLFDVKHEDMPAKSRGEGFAKYQPALFENGHIATGDATRKYTKSHSAMWDELISQTHTWFEDESIRQQAHGRVSEETAARDVDRTLYTLTMIARVFYAAAALQSEVLDVIEIHPPHDRRYCTYKDVCPACALENTSVMEEWL